MRGVNGPCICTLHRHGRTAVEPCQSESVAIRNKPHGSPKRTQGFHVKYKCTSSMYILHSKQTRRLVLCMYRQGGVDQRRSGDLKHDMTLLMTRVLHTLYSAGHTCAAPTYVHHLYQLKLLWNLPHHIMRKGSQTSQRETRLQWLCPRTRDQHQHHAIR